MLTLLPDQSGRIAVRPVRRADRDALIAANRASRDYHAPWLAPFTDTVGFETWFARRIAGANVGFVAHETATGALVGTVSLTEIVLGPLRGAYLGYAGDVRAAGRGLMTEAVRAAIRNGFAELGLHRIEANIQPANARSIALVRRLGFRQEGFSTEYLHIDGDWRDCGRWALLDCELDQAPGQAGPASTSMIEAFWARFREATGLGAAEADRIIAFGAGRAMQDELAELVRRRRKRATAALRREHGPGAGVLPAPGDLSIVLDGAGTPVSVIRTSEVRVGPLGSVDDAFAWDEGEGDRTRTSWLDQHRGFFESVGLPVDDVTETVFERFSVLWPDL